MTIEEHLNKAITGDVIEVLLQLPENSVHCIVTSPPYWSVRDYNLEPTNWPEVTISIFGFPITIPAMTCQLGLEKTPTEFVAHMVYVFRLARRVLRKDGTLWMNMGDCYNSKSGGYNMTKSHHGYHNYIAEGTGKARLKLNRNLKDGLKIKDMIGIPWMLAFAMRDDGWYLRQDIIWNKPNPMPESTNDRCTKAHEYIFLFSKSKQYFYDAYAISTEVKDASVKRLMQNIEDQKGSEKAFGGNRHNGPMKAVQGKVPHGWHNHEKFNARDPREKNRKGYEHKTGDQTKGLDGHNGYFDPEGNLIGNGRANKKSVWTINTRGTSIDHYATYPEELPLDPIKAGTSEHGVCAQCGAPWKRVFEKKLTANKKAPKTFVIDERDEQADTKDQGSNRHKDGHKPGHYYEYSNFSWVPTCKCDCKELKPAIVMDCFAGHNTTGLVARKLQRDFISIDKSAKYNGQSETRLTNELGMFR